MNLEHFYRFLLKNYNFLPNPKKTIRFFAYEFDNLLMKREKLKLGSIVFEFKEIFYGDIKINEIMEMRYNRQDNTEADRLKFDNLLKLYDWKWDFPHIAAFLFVGSISFAYLYLLIQDWFYDTFPSFERNPDLTKKKLAGAFYYTFESKLPLAWSALRVVNFFLLHMMVEFCYFFNIMCY